VGPRSAATLGSYGPDMSMEDPARPHEEEGPVIISAMDLNDPAYSPEEEGQVPSPEMELLGNDASAEVEEAAGATASPGRTTRVAKELPTEAGQVGWSPCHWRASWYCSREGLCRVVAQLPAVS